MCEEIIILIVKQEVIMASSGNSIHLAFRNCLDDSAEATFAKVLNARLSRWKYTNDTHGDWAYFGKWRIRLIILGGRVQSSNVLTEGKKEEGSKEEVISILNDYLSDLQKNNEGFSFEIADSDPLNLIQY